MTKTRPFSFAKTTQDGFARLGVINTAHGEIRTPAFMPVGTQATVKAMYPEQLEQIGSDVVLGNTYHLMLRPTAERIAQLGGLHKFMNWPHSILTDSGGFQVMSLGQLRTLDEEKVTFKSHIDGQKVSLSPERAMEIQSLLGSDIQMQLDECLKLPATEKEISNSMQLSLRWAERSRKAFEKYAGPQKGQACFAIVQGGDNTSLRIQSAHELTDMPFEGYAIGGLAVGEPQEVMLNMLEATCPHLPETKPRYLMGVGTPGDILEAISRGIDMFDCVMPTRAGRHGLAFTRRGRVNLRNARHANDPRPLDEDSTCSPSKDYSRAYLHHLIKSGETLGAMLLSWHNLAYYQSLMKEARNAIEEKKFNNWRLITIENWQKGDIESLT